MSVLYQTEPPLKSADLKRNTPDLRAILKSRRPLITTKLDPILKPGRKKSSLKFEQMHEELGSPRNNYILKKIQDISVCSFSPRIKRLFHLNTENGQSQDWSPPGHGEKLSPSRRFRTEKQEALESIILKNEEERIDRLIHRHQENEQTYSQLMSLIKNKSTPKKLKVAESGPLKIQEKTWYRDWLKQTVGLQKRTKQFKNKVFSLSKSKKQRCLTEKLPSLKKF